MGTEREVKVAAIGDVHFDGTKKGSLRTVFAEINEVADVLVLCGDLTTHGEPEQLEGFLGELEGVDIPVVSVLGNHDFEAGEEEALCRMLTDAGIHHLDGTSVEIEGIGFAGVKGFGGGFGRLTLGPFGEKLYKDFVQEALDEAIKLETALRELTTEKRIAVLHYAPIRETLEGEPEEIFPFLGSSRLLPPIETYGVEVVFHGHAHIGALSGETPTGIPVFNVARNVIEANSDKSYLLWTVDAPDRRRQKTGSSAS